MSTLPTSLRRASALVLLSGPVLAQTGPWADGEFLVRATSISVPGANAVFRIDPLSGHGEQLLSGFTDGTTWGRMAFDSYRGGFVTCMAIPPDAPNALKIWLLRHDGSAQHLPGFEGKYLDAFCATGDGRIYFQEHPSQTSPSNLIRWLDENGASHTLLDATGTAPLDFQVEHMIYHAPSNSLIATTSPWWSVHHCTSGGPTAFRVPLSADGSQVAGPIACSTYAGPYHEIMGLDELPNGELLVVCATGTFGPTNRVLELDPWTLAFTPWADPQPVDLNGGLWCDLLGKAVVLDDWEPDTLRQYSAGQSGMGTVLVTDVVLSNGSTGFSPAESIWESKVTTGDGNYCTTDVNSTGNAAHIAFSGSKSLAKNSFSLTAGPVPDAPYIFIYGPTKASFPFGNGTLCMTGAQRIMPPGSATGNVATVNPDLAALGITPGVWHFQCWFRDLAAGGSLFDLSDATQVTFTP
jgi:hypothetical protein